MVQTIPVFFATKDDQYINYLYVSITSVLINAETKTHYNFYILVPSDFSETTKKKIKQLQELNSNCSFSFINMKDTFKTANQTHEHVMYPTYYRLLIADLVPLCEKCIYLDSDTLVLKDLSEFYNQNIEAYYLAGVKAAGYQINALQNQIRLQLDDVSHYTNAGVLLMNLKKIRQDNLTQKFIELLENNYLDQDQDILNVACYKKIKNIHLKYNFMTKYEKIFNKCTEVGAYTESEIAEAMKSPTVIHYADKIKPWQKPDILFGHLWWQYARKTPYYEEILFNNLKNPLPAQQTVSHAQNINENILRELLSYYKKPFSYYKYKLLSKISFGAARKKYKRKFKEIKQKIKNVKTFLKPNKKPKKKFIDFIEKHTLTKDVLDILILGKFILKKKPREHLSKIEKIKFITCRNPVREAGGGQGAALTMNETVLDKQFNNIPIEFVYEKNNKFSHKKHLGPYFLYAGIKFALQMTKKDKNTVYVTHEEETGFGLWLMGKRYIIFSHLQGARLEEKTNNGEKMSKITQHIIKFVEKTAFKNSLRVCFPSEGAYQYYINSPFRGANANDFVCGPVVYNTLYLNHPLKAYPGIVKQPETISILSIGGLTIAKGMDQSVSLVEEMLKQTEKKIRYIIIGKGILQNQIEKELSRLSAQYSNFEYKLINRCSVNEMPYLQEISDVYLMLHRISIFDLATLEMMNRAKTVVLSDIGGNREFNKENNIILWQKDYRKTASEILNTDLQQKGKLNKKVYNKYFSHTPYKEKYTELLNLLVYNKDKN